MSQFDRELQTNSIKVLSNLWPFLTISKCLITLLYRYVARNIDRMRVPCINIFCNELPIYILEYVMAHKIFPDVDLDIAVWCRDQNWLEPTCWPMNLFLLHHIGSTSNDPSLEWRLSSRVMHSNVTHRVPFFLLQFISIEIARKIIKEYMVTFLKLIEHFGFDCFLNSGDRAPLLKAVDDWYSLGLSRAVVS